MANPVDPVTGYNTSKQRQTVAVPEPPHNQPHQPPKQKHAEDHTPQIEAASGKSLPKNRQASEQEGVPQSRSSTYESSVRNISSTNHQQDLYHVLIGFKVFNGVWHAALWATMKKYNISANLVQVIKHLYDKANSAVLFYSSIGDWFQTTAGV